MLVTWRSFPHSLRFFLLKSGTIAVVWQSLKHIHIVLVEPQESLNVGSVARAMQNLGFENLHLVAPRGYDPERARVTARDASVLLDTMTVHARFEDALVGMEEVVGLALRSGENPAYYVTLPQWASALPERGPRRTALVFGPEDDDLRREHLEQCRWVVRIPSTAAYPSFNLAQSVLIVLYELTRALPSTQPPVAEAPTWNDYFQLDRILDSVMTETGFVRTGSPAPVPGRIKNLLRRLELTPSEMSTLMALFSRIDTTLKRTHPSPSLAAREGRPER